MTPNYGWKFAKSIAMNSQSKRSGNFSFSACPFSLAESNRGEYVRKLTPRKPPLTLLVLFVSEPYHPCISFFQLIHVDTP